MRLDHIIVFVPENSFTCLLKFYLNNIVNFLVTIEKWKHTFPSRTRQPRDPETKLFDCSVSVICAKFMDASLMRAVSIYT